MPEWPTSDNPLRISPPEKRKFIRGWLDEMLSEMGVCVPHQPPDIDTVMERVGRGRFLLFLRCRVFGYWDDECDHVWKQIMDQSKPGLGKGSGVRIARATLRSVAMRRMRLWIRVVLGNGRWDQPHIGMFLVRHMLHTAFSKTRGVVASRKMLHDTGVLRVEVPDTPDEIMRNVVPKMWAEVNRLCDECNASTDYTDADTALIERMISHGNLPDEIVKSLAASRSLLALLQDRRREIARFCSESDGIVGQSDLDQILIERFLHAERSPDDIIDLLTEMHASGQTIPPCVTDAGGGFTFEITEREDPRNIDIGEINDCCMVIGNTAEPCLLDALSNPLSALMIISHHGEPVAHSWLRLGASGDLYLDNIEIAKSHRRSDAMAAAVVTWARETSAAMGLPRVVIGMGFTYLNFDKVLRIPPPTKKDLIADLGPRAAGLYSDIRVVSGSDSDDMRFNVAIEAA